MLLWAPMKRFFIRLILSLCFLLVRGNDHLHASLQQYTPGFYPIETLSDFTSFTQTSHTKITRDTFKQAHPVKKKESENKNEELEDEEDLTSSSKKYLELSHFAVALFYTFTPGFTSLNQHNRLPVCEHLSYSSSFKYLLHCVFRI